MAVAVAFPAGMTTCVVTGTFSSLGKSRPGYVRVYAERKFGYAGTDWMMDEVSAAIRLVDGQFAVEIPHSNQFGLIGDNGAPVTNIGYRIVMQPDQSRVITTERFVVLPTSLGAGPVALSSIADLGGWPNQTVIIGGPVVTPPSGSGPTLVQVSPGVFRKVA